MTNLNPRVEQGRLLLNDALVERQVKGQAKGISCLKNGSALAAIQLKLGLAKKVNLNGKEYIINIKSLDKWIARTTENFGRDTIGHFDTKTHDYIRDAINESEYSLDQIIQNHVAAQTSATRTQPRDGVLSKERMISLFQDEAIQAHTQEDLSRGNFGFQRQPTIPLRQPASPLPSQEDLAFATDVALNPLTTAQAKEHVLNQAALIELEDGNETPAPALPDRLATRHHPKEAKTADDLAAKQARAQERREALLAKRKGAAAKANAKAQEKFNLFRSRPKVATEVKPSAWTVSGSKVVTNDALTPQSQAKEDAAQRAAEAKRQAQENWAKVREKVKPLANASAAFKTAGERHAKKAAQKASKLAKKAAQQEALLKAEAERQAKLKAFEQGSVPTFKASAWTVTAAQVLSGDALTPQSQAKKEAALAAAEAKKKAALAETEAKKKAAVTLKEEKHKVATSSAWSKVSGAAVVGGAKTPQTQAADLKAARERFQAAGRKVISLIKASRALQEAGADHKVRREADEQRRAQVLASMKSETTHTSFAAAATPKPKTEEEVRAQHLRQIENAVDTMRRRKIQYVNGQMSRSKGVGVEFNDTMKASLKERMLEGHKRALMNELLEKKATVLNPRKPHLLSTLNKKVKAQEKKSLAEGKATLAARMKAEAEAKAELDQAAAAPEEQQIETAAAVERTGLKWLGNKLTGGFLF